MFDTLDRRGQRVRQIDRILNAQVHALPSSRTVHMGSVAGQEHRPLAERARDAVMYVELR